MKSSSTGNSSAEKALMGWSLFKVVGLMLLVRGLRLVLVLLKGFKVVDDDVLEGGRKEIG